ncbi:MULTISPECIES: hypothetical protein [Shewanella]|uniref:Uncharacterized protein n=1 Tax=Shewanella japonica TaxID=93973 RepID=A0ABN4YJ79_9GAMM|nr:MULTISPECIES: hypothetical protein [Shewanella]ARD23503.1 hypothetical protein SJ2017_3239 [Shewanella japonica]KPZ71916.1 hypothetical protein AN944_01164 [Shewanella sp. P1-14-1]
MNLDKSRKRIAKKVKAGFKGYPQVNIIYQGKTQDIADEVIIEFVLDEGAEPQQQSFKSKVDVREDEVIQTTLVKIIDRADAKTVTEASRLIAANT